MKKRRSKTRKLLLRATAGLVAAAVVQELRKPAEQRTWHGKVAGFVPYDFRWPTTKRLRDAYWNPEDPRVFTPRPAGLGWAVNFARVFRRAA